MSKRDHLRKFDHDLARQLHAEGHSIPDLARRFGVVYTAVQRVVDPKVNDQLRSRIRAYQTSGTCPSCGKTCSRNRSSGQHHCRDCAAKAATLIRDDTAWCADCKEWLPKERFGRSTRSKYRTLRNNCRACEARRRQDYRKRHRAKDLIQQRAHKRVKSALRRGELTKPDVCDRCGSDGRLEGHHDDYELPLAVEWLCVKCHRAHHRSIRSGAVT